MKNNKENNEYIQKKIDNFFEKAKKIYGYIFILFLLIIWYMIFGEEYLGEWYFFVNFVIEIIGYFIFFIFYLALTIGDKKKGFWEKLTSKEYNKNIDTFWNKNNSDILKENNFEKIIDDSMLKNASNAFFEHESNKKEIMKNSIGDINNSVEEWKIKIYLLIFLGIILFLYFNFYK